MTTVLHIDASVRGARSLSRRLSGAFVEAWQAREPGARIIRRDLSQAPPPLIDEAWIAACFTNPAKRTPEMHQALAVSDALIDELEVADILVIGTPMINYGMPALLKAWIDQTVRINRTFSFDLARGDYPLEPMLSGKILVMLTSCGEFGFNAGGGRSHMNHLDTHLRTASRYLGVDKDFHIGIEYQEFGDARHERSIELAFASIPVLVNDVARSLAERLNAGP